MLDLDGTSGTPTALRAYDFVQWPQVLLGRSASEHRNHRCSIPQFHPYPDQECPKAYDPQMLIYHLCSFRALIIIISRVFIPHSVTPKSCNHKCEYGSTIMGHNTTLPLALLYASPRPRDYPVCRSFGRTFSRLVLLHINSSSTQVPHLLALLYPRVHYSFPICLFGMDGYATLQTTGGGSGNAVWGGSVSVSGWRLAARGSISRWLTRSRLVHKWSESQMDR